MRRKLMVPVTFIALGLSACTAGVPFPTPLASDREVPQHTLELMVADYERSAGRDTTGVSCASGTRPGSGQVVRCEVVYADDAMANMYLALTSDSQIVARYR